MLLRNHNLEPIIEYASVRLVTELLCHSENNKQNPTISQIVDNVVRNVGRGQMLTLLVSQHLDPTPNFVEAKLGVSFEQKERKVNVNSFVGEVKPLGWKKLRTLASELKYPVLIQLFVDDVSFFQMEKCEEWCDESSLVRLEAEIEVQYRKVKEQAEHYFGSGRVVVRRWSELCDKQSYQLFLSRARDFSRWVKSEDTSLIETSLEMNCDMWGYRAAYKRFGISNSDLNRLLAERVVALAAHYRWKADVALRSGAIQVWNNERLPNPMWPVVLSNYDGSGYAPSVVFCD